MMGSWVISGIFIESVAKPRMTPRTDFFHVLLVVDQVYYVESHKNDKNIHKMMRISIEW